MKNQRIKFKSYFYRHIKPIVSILILLFLLGLVFSKQWISSEPKGCGPTKFINVEGKEEHIDLFYVENIVVNLKDCPLGVECFVVYTEKNKYDLRLTQLIHFIQKYDECPGDSLTLYPRSGNNLNNIIALMLFFAFTILVFKRIKK